MHAEGLTRTEVAGFVAGLAILGSLLVWAGAYRESMTLALLVLLVLLLLGVVLRATTVLFMLVDNGQATNPTASREPRRRITSDDQEPVRGSK